MDREPYYGEAVEFASAAFQAGMATVNDIIRFALDKSGLFERVEECERNHLEPFGCYREAEGGWVCRDTHELENAKARIEELEKLLQLIASDSNHYIQFWYASPIRGLLSQ